MAALSDRERARTARHARLAGLGEEGQRRIAAAHVAVVGAGGLGSPVVLALASAGVGTLTVIDDDTVELSNLQRQVLHRLGDIGARKTASAVRAAAELSETRVIAIDEHLDARTAVRLLSGADVVIDGTDTFATRTAVASACEQLGVPLVWGTVQEFAAQVTVFWSAPPAPAAPVRLADLYGPGADAPSCSAVGVFGPLCLQVGALLASEALGLVTGIGEPLLGRMLLIDARRRTQREVPLRPARASTPAAASLSATPKTPSVPTVAEPGDALVVDVRESAELAGGMIPAALHVPLGRLLADPGAIAAPGPVVVVCQSGVRAVPAARALRAAGIDAYVLAGGMDAWTRTQATRKQSAQDADSAKALA